MNINYRKKILEDGYVIIPSLFSDNEISIFKEEVNTFLKNNKNNLMKNASGISIPDFIKHNEFKNTKNVITNEKLNNILKNIFDTDENGYRFCSHNDIGINRIVGWHKDKLNGAVSKYETVDIWGKHDEEKHEIVKVLTYLEDHSNDNDGLKIVPKSHLTKHINPNNFIQLKPKLGDTVIFDQRITHRGMIKQVFGQRILVSFGFGKNNIFTDNFEKGTVIRQFQQNKLC